MKIKLLILSSSLLMLLITSFVAINIWIDIDAKKNIKIAKNRYSGKADDALISYMLDTNNSPQNRTRVAIWTLGQIQSEKALPILESLYINDPEGKTCYKKHEKVICQYELHKSINLIRTHRLPLHTRLNK